jgi:hypothetical protein
MDRTEQQVENNENQKEEGIGYYFNFKEVLTYYFRKKDPNKKPNINLRMMHGINKISMIMFLIAVIIIITRTIIRAL